MATRKIVMMSEEDYNALLTLAGDAQYDIGRLARDGFGRACQASETLDKMIELLYSYKEVNK